jgi:hypothetical protein
MRARLPGREAATQRWAHSSTSADWHLSASAKRLFSERLVLAAACAADGHRLSMARWRDLSALRLRILEGIVRV